MRALPGASCQMVSVRAVDGQGIDRAAGARREGGSAGRAVAGSARHCVPLPVITSARPLPVITAVAPAVLNDADARAAPPSGRAGESAQWRPLSADQAASRLAVLPVPAVRRAMVWLAIVRSRSTVRRCPDRAAGSAGPVSFQVPPVLANMAAVPGREHVPASSGSPEGLKAAAVSACSPQCRPAGVAAMERWVARVFQLV